MTTMTTPHITDTAKNWRLTASCRYEDPELWFPISETTPLGQAQTAEAKRICRNCPVLEQCREDILATEGGKQTDGRYGIHAALTPRERHNIARQAARKAAA